MAERDLVAGLIVDPVNQFYLSGFKAVIYFVVPGLEVAHAEDEQAADEVLVYYEHPEMAHHGMSHLDHLSRQVALSGYRAELERTHEPTEESIRGC